MFSETRQRVEDCPSGQPRPQPLPRFAKPAPLCNLTARSRDRTGSIEESLAEVAYDGPRPVARVRYHRPGDRGGAIVEAATRNAGVVPLQDHRVS
jgi:hypothetical protein